MEGITNADTQKRIHQVLDPVMKREGFKRNGRTYYQKFDDLIAVLNTRAVGAYFSSVTHWPSSAFSVWDGIWVGDNARLCGAVSQTKR